MLLSLIQRLFALTSLAVLALGGYFAWSWWDLHERLQTPGASFAHDQDWRIWVGGLLLLWSIAGRLPVALLLGRRGHDGERLKRQPGETLLPQQLGKMPCRGSARKGNPIRTGIHQRISAGNIEFRADRFVDYGCGDGSSGIHQRIAKCRICQISLRQQHTFIF